MINSPPIKITQHAAALRTTIIYSHKSLEAQLSCKADGAIYNNSSIIDSFRIVEFYESQLSSVRTGRWSLSPPCCSPIEKCNSIARYYIRGGVKTHRSSQFAFCTAARWIKHLVPLPAYDDYDGVHETRRFVHLPPVHVQLSTLYTHWWNSKRREVWILGCKRELLQGSFYCGRPPIYLSLGVARRGSAHAVIQPMARRRRRTSLMNYFPQMLIRVLAAATPLLPATIESHELKSGGSIAYYIYLHCMRLLGWSPIGRRKLLWKEEWGNCAHSRRWIRARRLINMALVACSVWLTQKEGGERQICEFQ